MNSLVTYWAQNVSKYLTLFDLGEVELFWDFTAPTALIDTPGCNTIDTSGGVTTFSKAWDFSGKGRHGGVPSKAEAPLWDNGAFFLGGQTFNEVHEQGAKAYTLLLLTDAQQPETYMWVGNLSEGATNGFISMGNITGAVEGETFMVSAGKSPNRYLVTDAPVPAGFYAIGHTMADFEHGDAGIYIEGQPTNLLDGQPIAETANIRFKLGKSLAGTGIGLTARVQKAIIYSTPFTAEKHLFAKDLVKVN